MTLKNAGFIVCVVFYTLLLFGCKSQTGSIVSDSSDVAVKPLYINCGSFANWPEEKDLTRYDRCGTMDEDGLIQIKPEIITLLESNFNKGGKHWRYPEGLTLSLIHI